MSLFKGQARVLDISPEKGDPITLLKRNLNLEGICCSLGTKKISFNDILIICKEAYYRLENGAVLAIIMQEKDNAVVAWGHSSWNADDLVKIMKAICFEVSLWRDEYNGIFVVSGRKM